MGTTKLKGIDISHHNKRMKNLDDIQNYDFVIMKASEGKTYKDDFCGEWFKHLGENQLNGLYHYARAESNNPVVEADNFLDVVEKYANGKTILALDVEADSFKNSDIDIWALTFCQTVYDSTGIKPLIYCSESYTSKFKKCADFGCGLWCAKWGKTKPTKISPWDICAIWQYSDSGIVSTVRTDLNEFRGSREQYLKYCADLR